MKRTIYKKLITQAGKPKGWRIEGSKWPYSAKMVWVRSTAGSNLTLFTGSIFNPRIDLETYDRSRKEYTVDLSKGDIIFSLPTEILLQTTGRDSVLIALECEFPENGIKRSSSKDPVEVIFTELPVIPVIPTE